MSESIPKEQIDEMLRNAVHQQLFLGEDKIMGRMPSDSMSFKDVGFVLSTFINDIKKHLHLINPEKLDDFISYFENKFDLDLSEVKTKVENNFVGMGNLEGQEIVMVYMVLTKLLEYTREHAYKRFGLKYIKEKYVEITNKPFENSARKILQDLSATGQSEISLLYNLCFIRLLAEKEKLGRIATNAKRQITRKVNLIVNMLIQY